jgi:hypothetical protein
MKSWPWAACFASARFAAGLGQSIHLSTLAAV